MLGRIGRSTIDYSFFSNQELEEFLHSDDQPSKPGSTAVTAASAALGLHKSLFKLSVDAKPAELDVQSLGNGVSKEASFLDSVQVSKEKRQKQQETDREQMRKDLSEPTVRD
jgi:hypothetical protein